MTIRQALKEDINRLSELYRSLDNETEFLLYEPGERDLNIETLKKKFSIFENSKSNVMFISENADEITGFIAGLGGSVNKTRHSIYIAIGIKEKYTGQNLGKKLFETLEEWAINNGFKRFELTVMAHNIRAIKLYKSLGYIEEGIKHKSIKLNNNYIDELIMYKFI